MKNLILLSLVFVIVSCAKPISKFSLDQSQNVAPATIKFSNSSQNADSYLWDFGDGSTSTEASPEYTYYLSGNYDVSLTAVKGGKKKISKQSISVVAPKDCLVVMQTSKGDMIFSLADDTPNHRDNFIKLAEEGYYEGLLFHRVISGFMAQGGDPKSKGAAKGAGLGSGGPGYTIDAEINSKNVHVKGALAAARQGDNVNPKKKSSGSQFYIVHGKPVQPKELEKLELKNGFEYTEESKLQYAKVGGTAFLDMGYTVYGQLVKGWDVLDKIAASPTDGNNRPEEDVIIKKVIAIK